MIDKITTNLKDNRRIIAFLSGQALSLFGSSLVQFALMWSIVLDTSSGTLTAVYSICSFAPQIVSALFGGAWADRYSRKKLIMYADLSIAAATVVLCILMMTKDLGYAPIFIITIIRGIGGGIQSPAVSAVLPQLVEEDKLVRVNSVNGMIQSAVMLLSPAAAGFAIAKFPLWGVLLVDAVTALIAVGVLLPIKIPMHERTQTEKTHLLRDVKEGLRYCAQSSFVKKMMLYSLTFTMLIVPAGMFTPLFIERVYPGNAEMNLMLNEMSFFIGGLIGGIGVAAWGGFKNRILTTCVGACIFGACTAVMGIEPPLWVYLAFIFVAGIAMPAINAPMQSLMQERIQGDMLGRVFSLYQMLSSVILMIASFLVGIASDRMPLSLLLCGSGILMALFPIMMVIDKKFYQFGLPTAVKTD